MAGGVGVGVGMIGIECDVYEISWEGRQGMFAKALGVKGKILRLY